MWTRKTKDPMIRKFLDDYHLHLLTLPREKVGIGDIYVREGKRTQISGNVVHFLQPAVEIPPIETDEKMVDDLRDTLTEGVEFKTGIGLLEKYLKVLGMGKIIGKVKVAYESEGAKVIRFGFESLTRDSVDMMAFGNELGDKKIIPGHTMYGKKKKYYIVYGLVRSPSVSIQGQTSDKKTVKADINALGAIDMHSEGSITSSGDSIVSFKGGTELAFGVQLYELDYNEKKEQIKLKVPQKYVFRRRSVRAPKPVAPKPVLIGDEDDDVFLDIE